MSSPEQPTPSPTPLPRVTAAMVAARAGVSTATVSLVTNGKTAGRVSDAKIAQVQEAVTALGYVVDGVGSSLATGRSNIVILVAPDVSNPFFAQVVAGLRESLADAYQLLLSVTDPGQRPSAAAVRNLLSLRPAGLLLDAPSPHFLAELPAGGARVVLDAAGVSSTAPSLSFDVASGSVQLAAHLAELGHTRLAYLDSVTGTETLRVRRQAFAAAAEARQMAVVAEVSSTIDMADAAHTFAHAWPAWAAAGVTAVVCCTDTQAYGVLQAARVAGIPVPTELAVTGFDDLPFSAASDPGLTTVHLPARQMGVAAGRTLLRLLDGGAPDTHEVTLPCTLVVRGSTAAAGYPAATENTPSFSH